MFNCLGLRWLYNQAKGSSMKRSCLLFSIIIVLVSWIFGGADRDISKAKAVLKSFFLSLNGGDYTHAAELFGGSYDVLENMNPGIVSGDPVPLWRNACTMNGFQCLKVKRIVKTKRISDTEYHFTIEFKTTDGNLFILGPCCGETESDQPGISQFIITVRKVDGGYKVMDLPPYVP